MTRREIYRKLEERMAEHKGCDQICHVHMDAEDNASLTCKENGEDRGTIHCPSDAYIDHWYGSVGVLLSTGEHPEAEVYFSALGLRW